MLADCLAHRHGSSLECMTFFFLYVGETHFQMRILVSWRAQL